MPTQMLIYETAAPISFARHGKCHVEVGNTFLFARNLNAVPLMLTEFSQAAGEYAIVFTGNGNEFAPMAVLGARDRENLYLAEDGTWQARYVPAFLRRYPFVFSSNPNSQTFTLCIDETFPGLNTQERGQALFLSNGKPSEYTESIMKFLKTYGDEARRTLAFTTLLQKHDLLEPMQANFELATGTKAKLQGFFTVSRAKLKALPDSVLAELAKTDALEFIYIHLQSMRHFDDVKDRLAEADLKSPIPPQA
ncbi:MAG TPA: SapC family protein [Holophaga sp.]|nr:SapC family protein [Holophaga sp.]